MMPHHLITHSLSQVSHVHHLHLVIEIEAQSVNSF